MLKTVRIILFSLYLGTFIPKDFGATINAASPSFTDVSAAVVSAANGDTVQVPAGQATWYYSLSINKGITIQGAGATATVITNAMPATGSASRPLFILGAGGTSDKRLTGIGMKGTLITSVFNKQGVGVLVQGYPSLKRVDHCQFDDLYCAVWAMSSNGVTDHNVIHNCGAAFRHSGLGSSQQYAWDHFRNYPGNPRFNTLNYMFHENETIEMTGDCLLADEVEACSWAIRHCTITYREAHGPYSAAQSFGGIDAHGDISPTEQYANISTLLYENDFRLNAGSGMDFLKLRGGQALVFNNRVVSAGGSGGAAVCLREERDEFPSWPVWIHPQYEDRVHNTYVWNNTYNGNVQGPYVSPPSANHMHIGNNPAPDPTAVAWITVPASLASLLPTYPHPLTTSQPPPEPSATPLGATPQEHKTKKKKGEKKKRRQTKGNSSMNEPGEGQENLRQ